MNHNHQENGKWRPISRYVFIGFALIAGYFLIMEHRAHVVQYLPFLLLLACPLMHFFHGGHGGHGGRGDKDERPSEQQNQGREERHHH